MYFFCLNDSCLDPNVIFSLNGFEFNWIVIGLNEYTVIWMNGWIIRGNGLVMECGYVDVCMDFVMECMVMLIAW